MPTDAELLELISSDSGVPGAGNGGIRYGVIRDTPDPNKYHSLNNLKYDRTGLRDSGIYTVLLPTSTEGGCSTAFDPHDMHRKVTIAPCSVATMPKWDGCDLDLSKVRPEVMEQVERVMKMSAAGNYNQMDSSITQPITAKKIDILKKIINAEGEGPNVQSVFKQANNKPTFEHKPSVIPQGIAMNSGITTTTITPASQDGYSAPVQSFASLNAAPPAAPVNAFTQAIKTAQVAQPSVIPAAVSQPSAPSKPKSLKEAVAAKLAPVSQAKAELPVTVTFLIGDREVDLPYVRVLIEPNKLVLCNTEYGKGAPHLPPSDSAEVFVIGVGGKMYTLESTGVVFNDGELTYRAFIVHSVESLEE
jgi:hypothetical protein